MTTTAITEKRCTGPCARQLSLSEFGPGKRPGTHHSRCRDCQAAEARAKRAASPAFQQRQLIRQALADLASAGLKRCERPECLKVLPLDSFYRNASTVTGRYGYCKSCCTEIDAARRPKIEPVPLSITYTAVHGRMPSIRESACCRCGAAAQEWAYDHSDPEELVSDKGFPYTLDMRHYRPMCRKCHRRYDSHYLRDLRIALGTAKPPAPEKTVTRECVICRSTFESTRGRIQSCSPVCQTALRSLRQLERHRPDLAKVAA